MYQRFKSAGRVGWMALVAAGLSLAPHVALAGGGEQRFATPEAAEAALALAAKSQDTNAMTVILGPASRELVSPDAVQAGHAYSNFVRRISEKVEIVRSSDSKKVELQIGAEGWPFPIPLVQDNGQWFFDTVAGREEILNRRIGADELGAIRVCRAYVEAQREYAGEPRNGGEILEYARHLRSATNTHDGLYWHAEPGAEVSPFGPLIAQSHDEGYRHETKIMGENLAPYRGYCFKILTRQGPHAPGGKYNYIINGHMLAGFALVAWPAEWGNSGVMTFIVSQQGKVYQKDLGPRTSRLGAAMTTYDPDDTWKPVTAN